MAKADPRQKQQAAKKPTEAPALPRRAVKPAAVMPAAVLPARMPKSSAMPLTSRTATLDDPLTTSLLAEVARRPTTLEVSPEQIAEVMAAAPDDESRDRDPDDPTE